jgi:hypothetical protein
VEVEVRHALTHLIVERDEGALRLHRDLHRLRNPSSGREERRDQIVGHGRQRIDVASRDQETVAKEERPMIEESHHVFGFEHDRRIHELARNLAKDAGHRHSRSFTLDSVACIRVAHLHLHPAELDDTTCSSVNGATRS